MKCDACGCRDVRRDVVEGFLVDECRLCGHLQGNDEAVARIESIREGRELGYDDAIYPVVKALRRVPGLRVETSSGGRPGEGQPPYLMFRLETPSLRWLEPIAQSIEIANRRTRCRWVLEVSVQRTLSFLLKPRFFRPPGEVDAAMIAAAVEDLAEIARGLRRDQELSWFRGADAP